MKDKINNLLSNPKTLVNLGSVVVLILIVWLAPLLTIWSVNYLFMLTIPYSFKAWAASFWLGGIFAAGRIVK